MKFIIAKILFFLFFLLLIHQFLISDSLTLAQQTQLSPTPGYITNDQPINYYTEILIKLLSIFAPGSGSSTGVPLPNTTPGVPAPTLPLEPQPTFIPTGSTNAEKLVSLIQERCLHAEATQTNGCYHKIEHAPLLVPNTDALNELKLSIYKIGQLQCVGFARASKCLDGRCWGLQYRHAANYPLNPPPTGYNFIHKQFNIKPGELQVGDILVWDFDHSKTRSGKERSPSGHMGVVAKVQASGANVEVAEANVTGRGEASVNPRDLNGPDYWGNKLIGWYRQL